MPEPTSPESLVPVSERITPYPPSPERSRIYNPEKIEADYLFYCGTHTGSVDVNLPIEKKQRALFRLHEQGIFEDPDPVQAWEWLRARTWHEWDDEDIKVVRENLTVKERTLLPEEILQKLELKD